MPEHGVPRRWAASGLAATRRAIRMRRPLRWQSVRNAIVVPPAINSELNSGAGVVASREDGFDYLRGTGVRRYSRELIPQPQTKGLRANQSFPRAIFGGYVFDHFGHFLLESLSRVWIDQTQEIDDSVPLVWISGRNVAVTTWMLEICRKIGLNRQVLIIDGSTGALAAEELLVPQAGCELREWIHPAQMRRLGTTPWSPGNAERAGRKVWLSRVGMGTSHGGLAEEAELEQVLADSGWSIVRPEELSIEEQVDVLAGASRLAGIEGSALHGLVLVGGFGGTVDIIRRQSNPNFKMLALAGGWKQRMIDPVGGNFTLVPTRNALTGEFVSVPTWEGIDVRATARAIDESSGRAVTN